MRNTTDYGLQECQGGARLGLTKGVIPTPATPGILERSGNLIRVLALVKFIYPIYGRPWHSTVKGIIDDGNDLNFFGFLFIVALSFFAEATFRTRTA